MGSFTKIENNPNALKPKLLSAHYITLSSPKQAQPFIKLLNSKLPLPNALGHVKRIWRLAADDLRLLICLASDSVAYSDGFTKSAEECSLFCRESFKGDDSRGAVNFCIQHTKMITNRPPADRREFDEWRAQGYWPTTFHPHSHQQRSAAAEEEIAFLKACEKFVLDVSKRGEEETAVVVVDSKHKFDEDDAEANSKTLIFTLKSSTATDASPLSTPIIQTINEISTVQLSNGGDNDNEYLLTGKWIIVRKEPCLYDAMALLHSRIKGICFVDVDVEAGALGGSAEMLAGNATGNAIGNELVMLQTLAGLNHRFSVYRYLPKDT